MTAANSIQMLLHNLDCDGTSLHAPLVVHELLVPYEANDGNGLKYYWLGIAKLKLYFRSTVDHSIKLL